MEDQKNKPVPAKAAKPEPPKQPAAKPQPAKPEFTSVKTLPKTKQHSPIGEISELLVLVENNGKKHKGFYQKWTKKIDSPHLKAKPGDGFFYTTDNVILKNVTGCKIAQTE